MKRYSFLAWLLVSILLFAVLGAFAKIMTSFNHNEHMYIAASVLISQGEALYHDFAYLQTPYLPILYGAVFKLFGIDSHYLFTGKLLSFLFLIISAVTLFFLGRRVFDDIERSLCVVSLFLLNMTIVNSATEVSNYIMPVAFSLLATYLFLIAISNERIQPLLSASSGLLIAIAVGTKLTYATIVFPFVAIMLLYPLLNKSYTLSSRSIIQHAFIPFAGGILLGALPLIFFFLRDPHAFLFNNMGYHSVNTQWRELTEYTGPMSAVSKLVFARSIFFTAHNLILIVGVLFGIAVSGYDLKGIRQLPIGFMLAFLLVAVSLPTALAPTPSFPQYFAVPVSFIFVLLIYAHITIDKTRCILHINCLVLIVLLAFAFNGPVLLKSIVELRHRDKWVALHVQDVASNIKYAIADSHADLNAKVATLSPLFAIEGNIQIYRELSTGPFLYRIGDLLTPEQRRRFIGTSPNSIGDLLAGDPPVAIIVSNYGKLDAPLLDYALSNSYVETPVEGLGSKRLYVYCSQH